MNEFYDWDDIRAELHDGDDDGIAAERARTEAWAKTFHLAQERTRLGLTQRQVAESMDVSPGRVSQIENGDLDANKVATNMTARPDVSQGWKNPQRREIDIPIVNKDATRGVMT